MKKNDAGTFRMAKPAISGLCIISWSHVIMGAMPCTSACKISESGPGTGMIMARSLWRLIIMVILLPANLLQAQSSMELTTGWKCRKAMEVIEPGSIISRASYPVDDWIPATVPGTVLTTLLDNGMVPDPFYGMNNELIPDIFDTGVRHYTYWFVNEFEIEDPDRHELTWLHFRGINYACQVFLNGHRLNETPHQGMFLRQRYEISPYLSAKGPNRLAVIVFPPDPPGNPNGGQGGDGVIARNVTHQYVVGWDWIQPVRDRNTGIWDQVRLEQTGPVNIKNPHVVTRVTGIRFPGGENQEPAVVKISTDLENPTAKTIRGILQYHLEGKTHSMDVVLPASTSGTFRFPDLVVEDPKLWWPNGTGSQPLYDLILTFLVDNKDRSDEERVRFGIREMSTSWNPITRSRQIMVNGQKIFIKGGNWIISDAMLRFSPERYDAEVRFHRDMNLNLIRIWGGAIMERPEFYEACDRYGLLVMQDFSMSGDCNGRWNDPRKKDDQWTRRQYPDDHGLFLQSVADQVKMLRNHPSLAVYCGGNEITPPPGILPALHALLDSLDGTRWFVESSTSDAMSYNFIGGNGDGPYSIQPLEVFWERRSYPFNSEVGSVGLGDFESLKRFLPDTSMIIPGEYVPPDHNTGSRWRTIEPAWRYHKYLGYGHVIEKYGTPATVREFTRIAQLANFDQYRTMAEGFSSHMWEWYTGFIIWKTQNPWTAMRGQMYDCYLDPNAGLFGLHHGAEPLHIMLNPVNSMIMIANHTATPHTNLMAVVESYDASGYRSKHYQQLVDIEPSMVKVCQSIDPAVSPARADHGLFISMKLMNEFRDVVSENLYWLPDSLGRYTILDRLQDAPIQASARIVGENAIQVDVTNGEGNPLAFFIRISLVDRFSGERILPTFYSDNYISVQPGQQKSVILESPGKSPFKNAQVQLEGWNVEAIYLDFEW